MIKVAILGFGKVGQTLWQTIKEEKVFQEKFQVVALWNRSLEAFDKHDIPASLIYPSIEMLLEEADQIDLVIECAHASVMRKYAATILQKTDLFISSPAAFSDDCLRESVVESLSNYQNNCFVPLGASIGLWDIIRLDKNDALASLTISMAKHPDSFKINDSETLHALEQSKQNKGLHLIKEAPIHLINKIAPQNTNTMAIFALATRLGFEGCTGKILADASMQSHIVTVEAKTKGGLSLVLERDNPASHGAVTGSATFGSFLESLLHYNQGISHRRFTFC